MDKIPYNGEIPWIKQNSILVVNHGSVAYGTNLPESDLDVKGVAIPPREYFHGFCSKFEQAEQKEPDLVIYDIRKFFNLASNCNPNIIEILFVEPEDIRHISPLGRKLLDNRDLFLSRRARHTFSGYAVSQFKRLQRDIKADRKIKNKHVMHLVRLMTMCKEILMSGKVIVKRPDKDDLLKIRRGEWDYQEIEAWQKSMDSEMDKWYNVSCLPYAPDIKKIDKLCQEIVEEHLAKEV